MKVLILTEPDDTHAVLVKLALEHDAHAVRLLFTADQPTKLKQSVFIDNVASQWKRSDDGDTLVENDYDVVWWRRARKPYLPKESTHPSDYPFVLRENTLFYDAVTNLIAPSARWVNGKEAANRSCAKLFQLQSAVACGITIPLTLCSNDPYDIRYFLLKHEQEGVIYKPLCANFWFEKESMRISYTTQLSFLELPRNALLQIVPGIFQKEVRKRYEIRVNYFDGYIVAAKLHSQAHRDGKVDWRAIPAGAMHVEPYTLPEQLEAQICALMRKMGLVFGALDFIVSETGEYVFLEINEQGQFLWIEEVNPEFQLLDVFVQFLLHTSHHAFQWKAQDAKHRLEDYKYQVDDIVYLNRQSHVYLNNTPYNA
mgnify:CR=1 FL=1